MGDGRAAGAFPSLEEEHIFEAPIGALETQHYFNLADGTMLSSSGGVAGGGGNLAGAVVYSNRPATNLFLAPGADRRIADEMTVEAVGGCELSGIELRYNGGGDGSGMGFDVEVGLYTACPSQGGQLIPGTQQTLSFYNDGTHLVLLDLLDMPIDIPKTVWLASTFSRNGAGWYVGSPASIGFSEDRYDISFVPCHARFTGSSLYAAFHARLHCTGEFSREFLAYLNPELEGYATYSEGFNTWIADDIQLSVDSCSMTSFEVAAISAEGPYTVTAALWESCGSESLIEGTEQTAVGVGNGQPEVFHFSFDQSIPLPNTQLWIAWKFNSNNVGSIFSGRAEVGFTDDLFCLCELPLEQECGIYFFAGPYAGLHAKISCEGQAPKGACCDVTSVMSGQGGAMCLTVPERDCLGVGKRWAKGEACPGKCFATNESCAGDADCLTCSFSNTYCEDNSDCPPGEVCENDDHCGMSDPFVPPCGAQACCTPPESPFGETCLNLTKAECQALVDAEGHIGIWQPTQFCEIGGQSCGWWGCQFADGCCALSPHDVGCDDNECCQDVCDIDSWCCETEWDHVCVREACSICELNCPPEINAPADGTEAIVGRLQSVSIGNPAADIAREAVAAAGGEPDGGPTTWARGPFVSRQVSVDQFGQNVWGDANHNPTIAIDPTNLDRIVVAWKQFSSISDNLRELGWAYSTDRGEAWQRTAEGVIAPGELRTDPVLVADEDGTFYVSTATRLSAYQYEGDCNLLYRSEDGGESWDEGVSTPVGLRGWMTIDRTGGVGDGMLYLRGYCQDGGFVRSGDGGESLDELTTLRMGFGTMSVGPDGTLYVVGTNYPEDYNTAAVSRSANAKFIDEEPQFALTPDVGLIALPQWGGPNPDYYNGRPWIGTDHSGGPNHGNVYVLGTLNDTDIGFVRSEDGGVTWSEPVRINNDVDVPGNNWQWFGTMSVAPNGRIDVVWNDTRNSGEENLSELFYAYSVDAGETWRGNTPVSPMFDSHLGTPPNDGIGFHNHMLSDNEGASVAYAATFNGEQDIYFLRINTVDCNGNGIPDEQELAMGMVDDCNENLFPDECEPDFDGDLVIDVCDDDIDDDGVPNMLDKCGSTPVGTPVGPLGRPRGDTTGNCALDLVDYERLRTCLLLSGTDVPAPSVQCAQPFDYDDDGDVDLSDAAAFARMFDPPLD